MRFDQAPLGGASNDLPTDDLGFELEQIAGQAERISECVHDDYVVVDVENLARLIASLARALSRKGVANV